LTVSLSAIGALPDASVNPRTQIMRSIHSANETNEVAPELQPQTEKSPQKERWLCKTFLPP
jgi:hypothetical protein